MSSERIFIGLGSNLNNRLFYLQQALQKIIASPHVNLVTFSSVYETEPVGCINQDCFLNMVAEIHTLLLPDSFLMHIQKIESELGRVRNLRWGPRTIDIDILYWGERIIKNDDLCIPHPEVEKRRFVLKPLYEIAPEFKAPPKFLRIGQLICRLSNEQKVSIHLPKESCVLN
ncbi:MAG: 2-amino-4-hydroxy-6-hydroxymethyldihydropteridine diphosphokinase [bacterium]